MTMKKKILLLMGIFSIGLLHAQIGINTDTPQALFHVKGAVSDVVITKDGNVGINTITPSNKLTIIGNNANTGLQLLNGKGAGNTIHSDPSGNASWKVGKAQYQTMVYGTGGKLEILDATGFPIENPHKLTFFQTDFDKAKEIYGAAYGWDNTNQHYVVPVTGVYRIAFSVYFQPIVANTLGKNNRAHIFINGIKFQQSGSVSTTDFGRDIQAYTMGLATLNKGDTIDLRVYAHSSIGKINVYGAVGHTFLLIESL